MSFSEVIGTDSPEVRASVAVPEVFRGLREAVRTAGLSPGGGESRLRQARSLQGRDGPDPGLRTRAHQCHGNLGEPLRSRHTRSRAVKGRQLHTKDYRTAQEFSGRHVIVVGAGISAIQLLDEVSRVTTTTWVTRREPEFRDGPFDEKVGRAAVAIVEDRVRRGLPPASVVSVTGIPVTPAVAAMRARGVLNRRPMFSEITEDGVRWSDGTALRADVILWCTGFRSSLDHLAPLMLRQPGGGIVMTGRLATQVAKDPRVHLVGYGPSASTIGANRAGRAAAEELMAFLELG